MLAHSSGVDRAAAATVGTRGLQQGGRSCRRRCGRADHGRREDQAGQSALLGRRPSRAMPRDLDVAFVAIDEIQLGADLERGHVFTDRMLNRRGREETLVLGAATVRPIVERLLPGANVSGRPRLRSSPSRREEVYAAPRRTAIVAFSAEEVYAIAELIRRQRGGAAVVLGDAAHPQCPGRTLPVGDVDYLVADRRDRDGLNLDVDHVAFASDRKFDGYQFRRLNPAEFAQIAGRAGRRRATALSAPPAGARRSSRNSSRRWKVSFEPVKVLQWRNTALDFSSTRRADCLAAACRRRRADARAPAEAFWCSIMPRATTRCANGQQHAPRSSVCGMSARFPTIGRSRRPPMRNLSSPSMVFCRERVEFPTTGSHRRSRRPIARMATSIRSSQRIAHIRTWTFAANRPGLAYGSRSLAGRRPRGRGPPVGCAARAARRALRRSPHQRVDAAAQREHDARNRNQQDRGRCRRGPHHRPARGLSLHAGRDRPAARTPRC